MIQTNDPFAPLNPEPLLVIISGPSAVGKDTVLQRMKERGIPFHFVITTTSRPPRPGEVDGISYHFVTKEKFDDMIANDEFLEFALVYGEQKGVAKAQVRQAFASGKDVIMRVDVQGAATLHEKYPEAVLIFLTGDGRDDLMARLKQARSNESAKQLHNRIESMRTEMERIPKFDYVVINRLGELDITVEVILSILTAEHHRVQQRKVSI